MVKVIFFSFDFFNLINEKNINEFKRFWETYGEDTYVASKIGETYVKSHEGNDLKNKNNTATCLKHFIGYSLPWNGRDRTPAYIPETILREKFLPPFELAVKSGAQTVMINSGETLKRKILI